MTFLQGLINARSHIIFILGLLTAFGLIFKLETTSLEFTKTNVAQPMQITFSDSIPQASRGELSAEEQQWAKTAWVYFKNNYQPQTGLVNSVNTYPAATMWDTASTLMALISAYRLEIIERKEFEEKLGKALHSLAKLPLFDGQLPNKSYNTQTLEMVNYKNEAVKRGIGWSALDIGRVLVPLNIIVWNYPKFTPEVKAIIRHWQLEKAAKMGEMYGATVDEKSGKTVYLQEGRLGYEQYSAKAFNLFGHDVNQSVDYRNHLDYFEIYGIAIPIDKRNPEKFKAHNYVVSESYILEGLEYGWDMISKEFAYRIYQAQEKRYKETGKVTAVSEDNLNSAPYFVYNTVYTDGKAWNAITETGADAKNFKTVSTKAALGWSILFQGSYGDALRSTVKQLNNPDKGWYSGIFEASQKPNDVLTANTNAIILEALCFKKFGRLLSIYPENGSTSLARRH